MTLARILQISVSKNSHDFEAQSCVQKWCMVDTIFTIGTFVLISASDVGGSVFFQVNAGSTDHKEGGGKSSSVHRTPRKLT